MLFNSYIFIFAFLPCCILVYQLAVRHSKHSLALAALLVFSWGFYAYWNPVYLPLLLGSILVNFSLGRYLHQHQNRLVLGLGITLNLILLGYFKYIDFGIHTINQLGALDMSLTHVALPLAISFFTFQQIAFLVDTYRKEVPSHDFKSYALFVSFFPQLIAGPIVSAKSILPQINSISASGVSRQSQLFATGMLVFLIGLFKKVIIADQMSPMVAESFDSGLVLSTFDAWIGTFAYTIQIYFDFSGYSDMAIGLGAMFGIQLPLNFYSPYRALSIIDFWRRWHITLSLFLRNYLYIPLGGNRSGFVKQLQNLMITMLLGGLWHGAGWTFVIWGALHGTYLCINHLWKRSSLGSSRSQNSILYEVGCWLVTMLAVMVAWVFFRASSVEMAFEMLTSMFTLTHSAHEIFEFKDFAILSSLLVACYFLPNVPEILGSELYPGKTDDKQTTAPVAKPRVWQFKPSKRWIFVTTSMAIWVILSLVQESEFLYFEF